MAVQMFSRDVIVERTEWPALRGQLEALRGTLNAAPWETFQTGQALLAGYRMLPQSITQFRIQIWFSGPHAVADPLAAAGAISIRRQRGDFSVIPPAESH